MVFSQRPADPVATPTASKSDVKQDPPPTPTLGTIKGRVTTDDGRVLSNTTVMARALSGMNTLKTAQVDSEGRFTLSEVPAAVYLVFAVAPGYVDESVVVAELSQLPRYLIGSEVKIRLVKGGVITGTVTNSRGEPLVGISVRAAAVQGLVPFMISAGGFGTVETDDRGIYRFYGIPPGQYTVEAGGGGQMARFVTTGFELDVPTFYPSSTYDTAVPVTVSAGAEATGIDIRYKGTEGHSLSGVVSGKVESTKMPAMSVLVSYAGTNVPVSTTIVPTTDAKRAYIFDGLADGDYDVAAVLMTGPTDTAAAASKRVTIRGNDVTGVELVMASLATVSGTIKLDPIAPEEKCDKRGAELMEIQVEIPRDDIKKTNNKLLTTMISAFGHTLSDNGDFSVRNLEAGIYRPRFTLPTEAWYIRSIKVPPSTPAATTAHGPAKETRAIATGAWSGTINVRSGANLSGVSVIVGQDAAGVRGRVAVTPEGKLIPSGLQVHLVPAEAAEVNNLLRYFETAVDRDGNFKLSNLPPGRYFILPRLAPQPSAEESPRPLGWDAAARGTLRREAEALNNTLELKPCQRVKDVALNSKLSQ
ncbi:MAG TPA: carboxypeptidase-like regulatory domain-containing protein [Pyrinomonadaceae bacterium]|nr:carboxypeptidase-like regulatory domain-containing protein [Pyrinomonadaceae bacterium]